jgi:hypothetical protein
MRQEPSTVLRRSLLSLIAAVPMFGGIAHAQTKAPNIVVIFGDDIGTWNISAYHRGMMGRRTPNIDRPHRSVSIADRLVEGWFTGR